MNAPGLIRITGRHYASECGQYSVCRSTVARRRGGRGWNVQHGARTMGRVNNLRDARKMIDRDRTRRATEILTVGAEVPY